MAEPPFADSRRLTGINPWLDAPGAVLEAAADVVDAPILGAWRAHVAACRRRLGWPDDVVCTRAHAHGTTLAFAAPVDQLYAATEVNEWALLAALEAAVPGTGADVAFHAPGHPAAWDEDSAWHTLAALSHAEREPALVALLAAAVDAGINALVDDDTVRVGSGRGARSWPHAALPPDAVTACGGASDIPIALVTGSNGKTTTVRLLAAICRAHGWRTAHTCTDGVYVDGVELQHGDWSGPFGARAALARDDIDAAVLETARGGILRRGLALQHAAVAVVTNISNDHFGEYGVDTLDDLACVKLTVAHAIDATGTLVVNADDVVLTARAAEHPGQRAWFALDAAQPILAVHRAAGGNTCGVRDGRLRLHWQGADHDLGAVASMPLSYAGRAHYNIANLAAASLAAAGLGIPAATIAAVLASFGRAPDDNPGRLQHWSLAGVQVFVDFAHNPDGLHGLLEVATAQRGDGRLGITLGQAGNREETEIRELAAVVAHYSPDRIILKDIEGYERGRAPGEIAAILRAEFLRLGLHNEQLETCLDEVEAGRRLLAWANPGDVVVLPTLSSRARRELVTLLRQRALVEGPAPAQ